MRPISLIKSGKNAISDNDFTIKYVKTGYKETDELIQVYNQMIETLRMEQTRTVEQSYFLEKLINLSPIGIIILDFDGKITEINKLAINILQIDKNWTDRALSSFQHPLIPQIITLKDGSKAMFAHNGFEKYRCQVEHIMHQGFPRQFIILEDLTSEILATEKRAYEKVIRMMAHEVNNSMGAINSILQTVSEYGFEHSEADMELKESLDVAIDRNNNLAKFIDNFADIIRLPLPSLSNTNLYELVQDTVKAWYAVAIQQNIDIQFNTINETTKTIRIDGAQIERVLSNAIKNAIESVGSHGKINIEYSDNPVGFTVIDNGPGIDQKTKEKLFTPFFSTKTNGQGIGLMLSREIIDNHNGKLDLYTNPENKLTYFEVRF